MPNHEWSLPKRLGQLHITAIFAWQHLIYTLQGRQLNFLGHLIRSENSTFALYQPLYGNNQRGSPCTNYIHCIHKL